MQSDPAHEGLAFDLQIEFGGRTYAVRRDLDLLKRVEREFGPVLPLSQRLDQGAVAFDDLVRLLMLVLRGHPIDRDGVERWLFLKSGLRRASRNLALPLYTLTQSDAETRQIVAEQREMYQKKGFADAEIEALLSAKESGGPFVPTGRATGSGSSAPHR